MADFFMSEIGRGRFLGTNGEEKRGEKKAIR
jgi:hypothetical protein